MSNTKLTQDQKTDRKNMLAELYTADGRIYSLPNDRTTFAFMPDFPGSDTCRMSVAICRADEKFKHKVGEYSALQKMFDINETVLMPNDSTFEYWLMDNTD